MTLFDWNTDGLVRNDHPDTSREAARLIRPVTGKARRQVYEAIRSRADGMTDEELQTVLQMSPSTQRPRRVELVEGGLVRDSGRTRKTKSGRSAIVWVTA